MFRFFSILLLMLLGVTWIYLGVAAAFDRVIVPANPFHRPTVPTESELEVPTCSRFDGAWVGNCDTSEGKQKVEMNIQQIDCKLLVVDGQSYPIDGMDNFGISQGLVMSNGGSVLAWDKEKSRIIANVQVVGQAIGKKQTLKYQYKNRFTLEKENRALIMTIEAQADTFVNDTKKVDKNENSCRLEPKVADPTVVVSRKD